MDHNTIGGLVFFKKINNSNQKTTKKKKERVGVLTMSTAWVVVLGDAGRSPRMQYHTLSLCRYFGEQVGTC